MSIDLAFFFTALNILIPPVISGIPTQSHPRKPWKGEQFTLQELWGGTFSGRMCEGSEKSFQFNVWAQETQEKGKAWPPGAFRGKMTHIGRERSEDEKSHLSLRCAGTRTEHSITGWREGADLFATSRTCRERLSCMEQLEQHTSPEGGLKCPFSWLTFLQGTEEATGCTGGAWEHQMVLRACLQPPLANTILAYVCCPKQTPQRLHPMGFPFDPIAFPHLCVWGRNQAKEREQ